MPRAAEELDEDEDDREEEDGEEEDEDGEGDDEDDETEDEAASDEPIDKPRRVRHAIPVVPVSPFGSVPKGASMWGIRKASPQGQMVAQSFRSANGAIAANEWPIDELEADEVKRRWGSGRYQVYWLKGGPRGGLVRCGVGRSFELLPEPASPAAPATTKLDASMPPEFAGAFVFLDAIEKRAAAQVNGMAQMAALFAQRSNQGGLDSQVLTLLMQNMQQSQAQSMQAMTAALQPIAQTQQALLSRLERLERDDGDDDAGGESMAATAVRTGMKLTKNDGIGTMIKAAIAENPSAAIAAIAAIPGALAEFSKHLKQQQAPAPAPPIQVRPRLAEAPQAPPPPPPDLSPGLNGQASAAAASAPPPGPSNGVA